MQKFQLNKSLHKWLSLIVGIQLIIWLGTGLYFNLMDHKTAGGNEYRQRVSHQPEQFDFRPVPLASLGAETAERVKLIWLLEKPYYQVISQDAVHGYQAKQSRLYSAETGKAFELERNDIEEIARRSYKGDGNTLAVELLAPPIDELPRQENPVWRVGFSDTVETHAYVDAGDGRVLAHINNDRRLRDLMFKLHFMDYANNGSFNSLLIIVFAIGPLLLSITGCIWLYRLIRDGQLGLSISRGRKKIALSYSGTQAISDVAIAKGKPLLDGLSEVNVFLPSSCGGGGTCGKCEFLSVEPLSITEADRAHISESRLEKGYRLGCQHTASEVDAIELSEIQSVKRHVLEVTATNFITPFIREVTFKVRSGEKLSFRAGAYMRFHIPSAVNRLIPNDLPNHFEGAWQDYSDGEFRHEGATRHYSLANYDSETEQLVFNIRWQTAEGESGIAGIGSGYLGALQVGDNVDASGPFCDFYATESVGKTRVFIGGGSGMAPLRSIIFEQIHKLGNENEVLLIYGARTEDDLVYRDEFERLQMDCEHFAYTPVLSKPPESWSGSKGYVQQELENYMNKVSNLLDLEFYLCGPMAMMIDVEAKLQASGVPQSAIFKDTFNR